MVARRVHPVFVDGGPIAPPLHPSFIPANPRHAQNAREILVRMYELRRSLRESASVARSVRP